jgi:hypothetical protein
MVLGLQGKFEEARQVASVDMTEQDAKSSMAYMRNMLASTTQFAAAKPGDANEAGDDWQPYAANDAPAAKSAAAAPVAAPKMQVVKATEEVQAPAVAASTKAAQAAAPAAPATQKVAGTPKLITPVNATGAQVKAATAGAAPAAPVDLLRTETD